MSRESLLVSCNCSSNGSLRFGTIALIFQLIPMLSMFFLLTTAAGAGLWAADMEKRRRSGADERAARGEAIYQDNPV